jgi:hypothetical protein
MTFPASAVAICNLALDHLNEASITSIETPETKVESLCARWYDVSRRAVLKQAAWNFALKRTTLAANSESPQFGYDTAYDLPNDYVNVSELGDYGRIKMYKIEGNQILIDSAFEGISTTGTMKLVYVSDFTNVARMDSLFIECLALHIALKIGNRITNNASLLGQLNELYGDALSIAQRVDGQQSPPKRIERSKFRRARLVNRTATREGFVNFGDY